MIYSAICSEEGQKVEQVLYFRFRPGAEVYSSRPIDESVELTIHQECVFPIVLFCFDIELKERGSPMLDMSADDGEGRKHNCHSHPNRCEVS